MVYDYDHNLAGRYVYICALSDVCADTDACTCCGTDSYADHHPDTDDNTAADTWCDSDADANAV